MEREDEEYSLHYSRPDIDSLQRPTKKLRLTTNKHIVISSTHLTSLFTATEPFQEQELPQIFPEYNADNPDDFADVLEESSIDPESNDERDFAMEKEDQYGTDTDYVDDGVNDTEAMFEDDQQWQDDVSVTFHTLTSF